MFELMGDLDETATAAAVESAHREALLSECRIFRLAAHWADLHHPDSRRDSRLLVPGSEQAKRFGGPGTPEVLEFCPAEIAGRLETTPAAAQAMIADALDCRHRLPRLWALVETGGVQVWRVRKVAQATRHLSLEAARAVDAAVGGSVATLTWGRFETLLDAKIIEADPVLADQERQRWEAERFVRAGRTRNGLRTIVARAQAGDVLIYLATVDRIAEILAARGDAAPADIRRSKAVGILAQPALALQMLYDHRGDAPDPTLPGDPSDLPDERDSHDLSSDSGGELIISSSPIDPAKVRPKLVLYVHLSAEGLAAASRGEACGVARFEQVGPVTLEQVRRFLFGTACDIRVQPVIDLNAPDVPVDSWEVPSRFRERIQLRSPASCFPFSPATTRRRDLDHTVPYLPPSRGGPPGQTRIDNLGPVTRREHRIRTHTSWNVRQPRAGTTIWRSPLGACYLSTPAGTVFLGSDAFAQNVWAAARSDAAALSTAAP